LVVYGHAARGDRGGGYGHAVAKALPEATQVANRRWHLMKNASQRFRDAARRSMTPIRRALGAGAVDGNPPIFRELGW
jgi:hypothetical protein